MILSFLIGALITLWDMILKESPASFVVIGIILVVWEICFACIRHEYDENCYYSFKKFKFGSWGVFAPGYLIYVLIVYYINPRLDKIFDLYENI